MKLIFKITPPAPSSTVASVPSSGYAPVAPMAPVGSMAPVGPMAPVASTTPTVPPFGHPPFGGHPSHGRVSSVSVFSAPQSHGYSGPFQPPSHTHGRVPTQPSSHVVSSHSTSFFGLEQTTATSMVFSLVSRVIAKYSDLSINKIYVSSSDSSKVEVDLDHSPMSTVTPDLLIKDLNEALRNDNQISLVDVYENHNPSHTHGRGF